MTNEHLGLYDELRAKHKPLEEREVERKRSLQIANSATAEPVNPFRDRLPPRPFSNGGYYRRYPDHKRRGRKIHVDSGLNVVAAQVIKAVCAETEMTHGELLGHRRSRAHSWPRHIAWWAIDHYCPQYSLKEIARIFSCDHTSVMHGIEMAGQRLFEGHVWTRAMVASVHQRLAAMAEGTKGER